MTPEELIDGLRERGLFVTRMQEGPVTIVNVLSGDPMAKFLGSTLQCQMVEFKPEAWSKPSLRAYEVRLNTAQIVVEPPEGYDPTAPDAPRILARHRANLIWEAAALPREVAA